MLMKQSWGRSSQLAVKLLHSQFGNAFSADRGDWVWFDKQGDTNSLIITIICWPLKTNLHTDRSIDLKALSTFLPGENTTNLSTRPMGRLSQQTPLMSRLSHPTLEKQA